MAYFLTEVALEAEREKLKRLQSLAHLPRDLEIAENDKRALLPVVEQAFKNSKNRSALDKIRDILARHPAPPPQGAPPPTKTSATAPQLELREPDPEQSSLNMQFALSRLVVDEDVQDFARRDGRGFQIQYNLNNDQMLTLCRMAVDLEIYKDTKDLNEYMTEFKKLDPVLKSLSPGVVGKLGLTGGDDGIIGSCSCCCP